MIKAIIFDNNGVLTTTENIGVAKMAELLNVNIDEFNVAWKEFAKPLDDGQATTDDFLGNLLEHFGQPDKFRQIRDMYFSLCYDRDEEMHELVKSLGKNYQTALLSNFGDSFEVFEKRWRTSETILPENIFVSVKLGMRKPHPEIYHYALESLNLSPAEAIFVDDREENVVAARELGMRGIVFQNINQFKSALAELVT